MPFRHAIDRATGRLRTVAEGLVTYADVRAHLDEEAADHALGLPELIDARSAELAASPAEIRDLVVVLRRLAADGPLGATAIVVATEYVYGMMRMLQLLVDDVCQIQPFFTVDEAERWLGAHGAPAA